VGGQPRGAGRRLPALAELNRDTGETVHLAVYDHGDVVYVDKLESPHAVVAKSYAGRRCPASCVATGRALLAYESREEIDSVLAGQLPACTARPLTEPRELEALPAEVRSLGYAINHGSYRDEVGGGAAPVRDHTGRVVASVGLCLPEQRFGPDRFGALRDRTAEAAVAISRALDGPARRSSRAMRRSPARRRTPHPPEPGEPRPTDDPRLPHTHPRRVRPRSGHELRGHWSGRRESGLLTHDPQVAARARWRPSERARSGHAHGSGGR